MTPQDKLKKEVAEAALAYVPRDGYIGVGTGSTVNFFIDALATIKNEIEGAVSSSEASTERLKDHGIEVLDLNSAGTLSVYVDGADEVDEHKRMIKGGGGALTREKIVAACSEKFICIVDESKLVGVMGKFPLPVEVIPMARSYIARELTKLGGTPELRKDFVTDNGNVILDVYGLHIIDPLDLEQKINNLAGVVSVGIFGLRGADVVLVGSDKGIRTIK
ncbi:MAG: ribose-5-phosphate isomerase RpiA [bacterium]